MNITSHKTQFSTSFPHSKHIFLAPLLTNDSKRHNVADTKNLESRDWNSKLRPRRHDKNFCPFLVYASSWFYLIFFFFFFALAEAVSCLSHANLNLTHVCWQTIRHLTPQTQTGYVLYSLKCAASGRCHQRKLKPEGQGCGKDILRVARRTWPDLNWTELNWAELKCRFGIFERQPNKSYLIWIWRLRTPTSQRSSIRLDGDGIVRGHTKLG